MAAADTRQTYAPYDARAGRSLLGKAAWSAAASSAIVLARFVVTVMAARRLGPSAAGRLAYVLWIQEIVAVIAGFGLQSCVSRFAADLRGRGHDDLSRSVARWLYLRFVALAVLAAAALCAAALLRTPAAEAPVWITLALSLLTQSLGGFYLAWLAGRQEFDRIAPLNAASGVALVAAAAVGMELWGVPGVLLGYAAGSVFPAVLSCRLLRRPAAPLPIDPGLASSCLKYSAFAWFSAIVSAFVCSRMEVAFLEHYWGSRDVAMFSVGLTLSALATQLPLLLSGALMPHFAESAGALGVVDARGYRAALRVLAALLFPLCLGAASLVPVLLPALYGASFAPAVPNAVLLTAFSALAISNVSSALLYAAGRPAFIAASGLAGAALSLVLCVIVIPVWGAWGAAISRSAVQTTMAVLGAWYIHRRLACPAPFRALAKILGCSMIAALCSFAIIRYRPTVSAMAFAVPVAAAVYVAMLRATRALDPGDAVSLRMAAGRMPALLAGPAACLLGWIS